LSCTAPGEIAIALLAFKREIKSLRSRVRSQDFQAVLKFLVITFIVLPVLPRESLDQYLGFQVGKAETVENADASNREIAIWLEKGHTLETGDLVTIEPESGKAVQDVRILRSIPEGVVGELPEGSPQKPEHLRDTGSRHRSINCCPAGRARGQAFSIDVKERHPGAVQPLTFGTPFAS